MSFKIKKVAVLGSGVMGSGIAAHLANVGLEVLLLDIVPFDLTEDQKKNPTLRNSIVNGALKKAIKSKPAPLFRKSLASRITTGNFDDDMSKIADCDWVIEVVIERLDIKKQIFEEVEKYRKPGSLISSNTSGIPISMLAEGRSEDFQKNFCGTHFFNPPRYLRLFEVIPHAGTDKKVLDFWMDYGDKNLGKQTVMAKDTPAFVGNRIGTYSMYTQMELAIKHGLTVEETDKLTGPVISRPGTGTFRLQDLVGIDTGAKVTKGVVENCPTDEFVQRITKEDPLKCIDFLLENKFYGNKSGQGFYQKTKERDDRGKSIILGLDLNTLEYRPKSKSKLESLKLSKSIEVMSKRLQTLIDHEDDGGKYLREYFAGLFAYSANRIPEIADQLYTVDDAMRAGYAWDHGPFELWDLIGVEKGIEIAKEYGHSIPAWVTDMIAKGSSSFYSIQDGEKKFFNHSTGANEAVPSLKPFIILDNYREKAPVLKNTECIVHDIGDGVMNLEFISKANAIGENIGLGIMEAIQKAEDEGWNGFIIGNNAKNFSVGANLMAVGMFAMQGEFDKLNEMVDGFQKVTMRMRHSAIPTAVATQGYVFGGACELAMHADTTALAAESYIGLVEVGVGLLPGGSGTKEMALRASNKYFDGDVQMPTLIEHFKPIATASVATSAAEAYDYNLMLPGKDKVIFNNMRNIAEAKKQVLNLSDGYVQPIVEDVTVLGRAGLATLYTAINEFRLGEYMSDYDVEISRKVAYVMAGGDLTQTQKVSQQYLLYLEREAFLYLLGQKKTQERIQYMLMNNKPLRN